MLNDVNNQRKLQPKMKTIRKLRGKCENQSQTRVKTIGKTCENHNILLKEKKIINPSSSFQLVFTVFTFFAMVFTLVPTWAF